MFDKTFGTDAVESDPCIGPGSGLIGRIGDRFIGVYDEHLAGRQNPGTASGRIGSCAVQDEMNDIFIPWRRKCISGEAMLLACMDKAEIERVFPEIFETVEVCTVCIGNIFYNITSFKISYKIMDFGCLKK